ncbi:ribonuclease T2 family protein [Pseudochelatococcus sp. G4_1912]|uniref:ribonuclease T2 family protein n=1 Tax=Pseudochelatococcus sp. G4_1912 TaxID=3114288 RepID=UPI0039C7321A
MNTARAVLVMSIGLGVAVAQARPVERAAKPGVFDFYVLALSWSPGFCALGGKARQHAQCTDGKEHGFVVHGLWPQYEHGFPRECSMIPNSMGMRVPSRYAMSIAADIFPDQGLARHQWRMHGTCSGKTPEVYFRETARARDVVAVPRTLQNLRTRRLVSTGEVERAFIAANPGLEENMIATACESGRLKEVRICLTRDLSAFRACSQVDRRGCRDHTITIDAPQ